MRYRLSRTFILRVLLVVFIGQCITSAWSLYHNRQVQEQDVNQKLTLSAKQLASIAATSEESYDYTFLGKLMDELLKDRDVEAVRFVHAKGFTIFDKKKQPKPSDDALTIAVPVMTGAEKSGKIAIVYNLDRVENDIYIHLLATIAFQGVVYLILVFLITYFFQRDVGERISGMGSTIRQVTSGDLTSRTRPGKDDELGTIASGLDFLIDWLSSTVVKIKTIAGNAAAAMDHLNSTFKEVISGMNRQQLSTENGLITVQKALDSLEQVIADTDRLMMLSTESTSALHEILEASQGVVAKMDRLSSQVHTSYEAVLNLSGSSREVANKAGRASLSMEDASAAVRKINESVAKIGTIVSETTELSAHTTAIIADRGIKSVEDAIVSMQRIEELVGSLSSTIANLGARSKDIAKVLDVIKEVTEQTKLLSLNAQILSGQAGEHGKPFAVVASEMKSLSDKTAVSTKEIEGIVSAIQHEIRTAVTSTRSTTIVVAEGKAVAAGASDALQTIQEASQRSTDMVRNIETVASVQQSNLGQIVGAFDEIQKLIFEVNRATAQEEESMEILLSGFGTIRDAMEITRTAAEDQFRSIQLISENLALVSEKSGSIANASAEQRQVNEEMIRGMRKIIHIGSETVKGVHEVSKRFAAISREVESLYREIKTFKTGQAPSALPASPEAVPLPESGAVS